MSDLAIREDVRDTRLALASVNELTTLANTYMKFPPNGKSMNMQQAAALAATAWMLDADPYNDELYPTSLGIQKGIMLYRRKAKQYCQRFRGSSYSIRFRLPEDGEIDYDPQAGDTAIVCELIDAAEHKEWEERWSKFFNMLYEASKDYKYADNRATRMAGPEPIHIGYGVVDHRESFSGEEFEKDDKGRSVATGKQKPEMMVREQRRNKRAEKAALKSAFPDLMAKLEADPQDWDLGKIVDVVVKEVELKQLEPPRHKQEGYSEKQELLDLGFEDPGPPPDVTPPAAEIVPQHFDPPTPSVECKFGDAVVADVISQNLGVKDPDKAAEMLNRSKVLAPAMEAKWYRMWVSFYCEWRKKGNDKDSAADHADNFVANNLAGDEN